MGTFATGNTTLNSRKIHLICAIYLAPKEFHVGKTTFDTARWHCRVAVVLSLTMGFSPHFHVVLRRDWKPNKETHIKVFGDCKLLDVPKKYKSALPFVSTSSKNPFQCITDAEDATTRSQGF